MPNFSEYKILSAFAVVALFAGCGGGNKSDTADAAGAATPTAAATATAAAAAAPLTAPSGALSLMADSVVSASALADALASTNAAAKGLTLTGDPGTACHGDSPINLNDPVFAPGGTGLAGEVNERAPYYASARWYCLMHSADGETIPGSFQFLSQIVCALGDVKFDGSMHDKDSTLEFSTKCFTQAEIDDIAKNGTTYHVTVTAGPRSVGSTHFEKQLDIGLPKELAGGNGASYHVLFSIDDKHVAFSSWNDVGGKTAAVAANLDVEHKILRYESVTKQWNEASLKDNNGFHHTRVALAGEFDSAGKMKSLTSLQGLASDVFYHASNGGNGQPGYSSRFISMKGNPKDGIRTHDINTSGSLGGKPSISNPQDMDKLSFPHGVLGDAVDIPERNACFGNDGVTCAGNDGLKPTVDDDLAFYLFPKASFPGSVGEAVPEEWAKSDSAFLSFDAVEFKTAQ